MDNKRFRQIRDWLGYDDSHLATALAIKESVVTDYCQGRKQIPDEVAGQLEFYMNWWINAAGIIPVTLNQEWNSTHNE